jgi:hypothetical protein
MLVAWFYRMHFSKELRGFSTQFRRLKGATEQGLLQSAKVVNGARAMRNELSGCDDGACA